MNFTDADLAAYLDEALDAARMAEIERAARTDAALVERLRQIIARRDAGVHALGEIWRRHRLSCPPRERLGSYLLEVLDPDETAYVRFHLETIGCRACTANLADLRARAPRDDADGQRRRRRYFESSAGYLRKGK